MALNSFLTKAARIEKIDFSYLEKYEDRKKYKIPTMFDKLNFEPGQKFKCRVTHTYDPSKFYIVTKYDELEAFQHYLFKIYYLNSACYKMPKEEVTPDKYCVVYCECNFYRAVIVTCAVNQHVEDTVQVFYLDYGIVSSVHVDRIHRMNKMSFLVPQFSIRASLAGVCPLSNETWLVENVSKFHELVLDKDLVGLVINVNCERSILNILIAEPKENCVPIHESLVLLKHARYFEDPEENSEIKLPFKSKLKYLYLFPSHEVLESGQVPSSVSDQFYYATVAPLTVNERYFETSNIT